MQKSHETIKMTTRDGIESVRSRNPIDQIIGRYIDLRPSGRRLVGRCPLHKDKSPSLVVYPSTQSWYCFGCGLGGDVFKFVELIERVPFAEALQKLDSGKLATRRTTRTVTVQDNPLPPLELSAEHLTLLTAATEAYHAAIFSQSKVLEYLARRRIDLDMIRRHRIGYATGDNLARYFRFRGWDAEIANNIGLIGPHGEYFHQRIVIPELRDGKATYLVGRATQKCQKAKYLGLPGVPKPLYGVELSHNAAEVLVCEGAFDWLTLIEWDYPTVALLGSHLKRDLVDELANAKRILIVTDSDDAGRRSARQLAETFGERACIVPPLPNAKDVNELAMQPCGREIFAVLVQQVK